MTDFIINFENEEKLSKEYLFQNKKIKQIISMYLVMKNILYDVNDYIDHNGPNILQKKKFTNEFFLKYIQIKDIYQNHRFEIKNLNIDYTIICATAKGSKFEKINCDKVFNSFENNYNASKIIKNFFGYSKIVGYDLYGEEDIHYNLEKFKEYITNFKLKSMKDNITWNYYFHAGENHNIYTKNINLEVAVDTAKRIGHGLQLINDTNLKDKVKDKNICIEINPISNQVLDYVPNLSFHPAINYIKENIPISISYDDLFLYGYDDVSYDWVSIIYSWNLNFTQIIQIIINSFKYSSYINNSNFIFILNVFEYKFEIWLKNFLYQLRYDNNLIDIINISKYLKNTIKKDNKSNSEFLSNENYKKYLIDNLNEDFGIGEPCILKQEEIHKQKYLKYKEKYISLKQKYTLMQ
jgi:adenosine deaminase